MKTKLCRPVLIRTNEESHLQIVNGKLYYSDKLFCANHPDMPEVGFINPNQNQQLILISLDTNERIEEGDKFYNQDLHLIGELIVPNTYKNVFKVIATQYQSQLSPEYIQRFVEEYNKGDVKDVDVEIESLHKITPPPNKTFVRNMGERPKLTNGFVTIVEKEQLDNHSFELGYKACEKHYKDLKSKMYTEEEVKSIFDKFRIFRNENENLSIRDVEQWFDQHKKK